MNPVSIRRHIVSNLQNLQSRRAPGFTLIELLIVVAIIAILAAVAVPNFLEAQARSKVARVEADFRNLATAIEAYHTDNNDYPLYALIPTPPGTTVQDPATGHGPTDFEIFSRLPGLCVTTPIAYFTSIPRDPFANAFQGPEPMVHDYSYKNCRQNARNFEGETPPAFLGPGGSQLLADWGEWRLSSAGPDGTRITDIKANIIYDATNGTVSPGDIVRSQKRSDNAPK